MVSVITEKPRLENGECFLGICPPKWKRRKASAVRDFPPRCGPNAQKINPNTNEDIFGGNSDTGGSKGVDLLEAEGKKYSENIVKCKFDDLPSCSNGVACVTTVSIKCNGVENMKVERSSGELVKHPGILRSDGLARVSLLDARKPSEDSRKIEVESTPKMFLVGINGACKDLREIKMESLRVLTGTNGFHLEHADFVGEEEKLVEETGAMLSSLPHYPIPSNIIRKQGKYPPRKRVSALRDFPSGCGSNVSRLNETENSRVVPFTVDKRIRTGVDDEDDAKNNTKGILSEKSGEKVEALSDFDKGACTEKTNAPVQFKERQQDPEGDSCRAHVFKLAKPMRESRCENVESLEDIVKQEFAICTKYRSNRKMLSSVPSGEIQLREESVAGFEHDDDRVVVYGLMAAPRRQWRECKVPVKSSIPTPSTERSKRKRTPAENDIPKPAVKVAGKSTKTISPSTDTDEEHHDFRLVSRRPGTHMSHPRFGARVSTQKGARSKVRETLRLFQAIVRKLLHPEETKSKEQGNTIRRIDLYAARILREKGQFVNTDKSVMGTVPGVEVGDEFLYRVELMTVGVHHQLQAGIDFVRQGKKHLAVSIVASGGYANDLDNSDVLIYTGQGGNSIGGAKQPEDQKLERGNLALKNSIDEKNPVRVIRGIKETKATESADKRSKLISTYTYDGLYTVEKYWHDIGRHGKLVFKFELRRIPGQPELAWKEVKKSKKFKVREGRILEDISEGKEKFPIGAVNTIDNEKPPCFTYINHVMHPDWCRLIPRQGCDCTTGCSDSEKCSCAVKNGGQIPYNYNGAIVQAKPLVYECGPSCKCPLSCPNRVSQHGIMLPLEIFKTKSRGWGVRSLSSIPSGGFICEYIGELLDDREAEQRTGNDEYLFDIGQNYNDHTLWDGLSALMPDSAASSSDFVEDVGFTIDAAKFGNVGRFINHSCSPNLYAQNVLYDHDDRRIPHIMFFAAENIPPLQELAYHYNYVMDQVHDSNGNIKIKNCYCGSSECTGRMY